MTNTAGRYAALDILDRTFRIYRENFVPVVGFVALVTIPITLITQVLSSSMTTTFSRLQSTTAPTSADLSAASSSAAVSILVAFLSIVQVVIIYSVLSYLASENYLGRKPTISEALNATRSRLFNLGCGFILFYIVLVILAIFIVAFAAVCSPAVIGLVVVAYIGLATFALLTPVLVLEDVRPSTGVNRAYGLGRARFWTMLIVLAAVYIISLVLNVALGAVIGLLGGPTVGSSLSGFQVLNTLATTVVGIFITPLFPIAMTLIYYDIRTHVEGLDLALAALDKPDARPSDLQSPSAGPLLTSRDLVNMIVLGVMGVALALLAGGLLSNILSSVAPGLTLPRR